MKNNPDFQHHLSMDFTEIVHFCQKCPISFHKLVKAECKCNFVIITHTSEKNLEVKKVCLTACSSRLGEIYLET